MLPSQLDVLTIRRPCHVPSWCAPTPKSVGFLVVQCALSILGTYLGLPVPVVLESTESREAACLCDQHDASSNAQSWRIVSRPTTTAHRHGSPLHCTSVLDFLTNKCPTHLVLPNFSCHLPLAAMVGAAALSASGISSIMSWTVATAFRLWSSAVCRIINALDVFFCRSDQVLLSGVRMRPAVGVDSRRSEGGLSDSRRASSSGGSSRSLYAVVVGTWVRGVLVVDAWLRSILMVCLGGEDGLVVVRCEKKQ